MRQYGRLRVVFLDGRQAGNEANERTDRPLNAAVYSRMRSINFFFNFSPHLREHFYEVDSSWFLKTDIELLVVKNLFI